jgi:hypothetical protein
VVDTRAIPTPFRIVAISSPDTLLSQTKTEFKPPPHVGAVGGIAYIGI